MGATTIWERWDSMLPDGSVNPGQMTSFNHYALGGGRLDSEVPDDRMFIDCLDAHRPPSSRTAEMYISAS